MDIPKLKIIPKKYTGETSVISLRLPKDMIEDIDSIAKSTGRTRNELLLTCMEFALKHMEIIEEENK
jgi:predicted DNA-binding protein